MRIKRTSKRRWKKRAALGRAIPMTAIVDHRLDRWFRFVPRDPFTEFYCVVSQ